MKNIRIWQMAAILAVGIALACGDRGDGTRAEIEQAAKTLDDNVERSLQVGEETYDAARAEGENDVEAAGDAYDAILAEPGDPNAAE